MFTGLRRLHISLAAKCQLLFGSAVVLIITAALLVPWWRMEQLMEQVNERAAGAVGQAALWEHVLERQERLRSPHPTGAEPAGNVPKIPDRPPTTTTADVQIIVPARLVGLKSPDKQTRFDRIAIKYFEDHPDAPPYARYYETKDGVRRYRYARPLFGINASCRSCHVPETGPTTATAPTTATTSGIAKAPAPSPVPRFASAAPATGPAAATAATAATTASTTAPAADSSRRELLGIVSVDIESGVETSQQLLNRVFLLVAGLLAGSVAVLVFFFITDRFILRPVRVLQETAEKVSEGDLNIRSDINTGDEFQQLSETLNTMLANLQAGEDQLRAINKSLDLKLGQLAETNVALYESNRLKSEFLANVSHELRTPLNSILGFAELLRDAAGGQTDAKQVRYVQNIVTSGRNLLDLINDLLDLAKIEAGRMEVRSEPLSLSDLFEGLTNILKPLCEKKSITIDARVGGDVPVLQTDPAKLQQVLYNFLSNAIKFSPDGGRITLSAARETDAAVRVSVADQGPGIPRDKQAMIFEKFRQLDGGVTRQHSGTGLGLAISRELTTLLGGTIGVASEPGEGATFWITLPPKIAAESKDVRGKMVVSA
jgi:signal transduction histidine kinase